MGFIDKLIKLAIKSSPKDKMAMYIGQIDYCSRKEEDTFPKGNPYHKSYMEGRRVISREVEALHREKGDTEPQVYLRFRLNKVYEEIAEDGLTVEEIGEFKKEHGVNS